ncbi:hypothetical protein LTR16_004319 [Cryomyces antarcticus]|uniref:Cyclic nucleotide-binding domain-containing protein n=1 Tax=Cryomyces antarcticus TaxID=329879 RepID=A0ABR0KS10_9PEZI|nr:hypothetical protein LTR16_004319 [Cryomyces antarcticus]
MLGLAKQEAPSSKCYFTNNTLPAYIDGKQPPTKKKPFSTVLAQPFSHSTTLILPSELYELIKHELDGDVGTLRYSRVNMSLGEIISGDFFNHYVKIGNVLMLSEGRHGVDHVFSLCEGVLRLELDKATYERAGLVGSAIPDGGRKHVKTRYGKPPPCRRSQTTLEMLMERAAIELNLRLPSMVHGKKGFERIVWACKNVLNHSLTWLFYDLRAADGSVGPYLFQPPSSYCAQCSASGPISKHYPLQRTVQPECLRMSRVAVPQFPTTLKEDDVLETTELLEWLGLVTIDSPRVRIDDNIDPYLSRYALPGFDSPGEEDSTAVARELVRLRWHGFIPPKFITQLFVLLKKAAGEEWFVMNVGGFKGEVYTILKTGIQTSTWECC